jgi:hypothetical protein
MDTTDLPPAPPEPTPTPGPASDVPLRPSYGKLLLGGVLGALVCSGIAVLVALQLAKPDISAGALIGPAPAGTDDRLAAVAGLRAEQPSWSADPKSWRVTLTWQPVDGAVAYVVSRNGRRLERVEVTDFVDGSVTPLEHYRYEVVALDADGNASKAARTTIRTDALPKEAARVQGRWVLALKVQSSSIGVRGGRIVVSFSPTCKQGPCDVRWEFEAGNTGTARRQGATYEGTGSGSFFFLGCHGETISSAVTMRFHVEKARTVGTTWRATTISGTLTESVGSFSNCLAARNVFTYRGTAQG